MLSLDAMYIFLTKQDCFLGPIRLVDGLNGWNNLTREKYKSTTLFVVLCRRTRPRLSATSCGNQWNPSDVVNNYPHL